MSDHLFLIPYCYIYLYIAFCIVFNTYLYYIYIYIYYMHYTYSNVGVSMCVCVSDVRQMLGVCFFFACWQKCEMFKVELKLKLKLKSLEITYFYHLPYNHVLCIKRTKSVLYQLSIYIYIYICMYVCMCARLLKCMNYKNNNNYYSFNRVNIYCSCCFDKLCWLILLSCYCLLFFSVIYYLLENYCYYYHY